MRFGYVYMLANRKNGTIYLGMTSDLTGRPSSPSAFCKNAKRGKYARSVGWGERHALTQFFKRLVNCLDHSGHIAKNVVIGEANNAPAQILQNRCTFCIIG